MSANPHMPGALEFAQLEARISSLTDAELVDMVEEHPGDFEPWALDLGRTELARRRLAPTDVDRLRTENAAEAVEMARPRLGEVATRHLALHVLIPLGLVAFPLYFVLARRFARDGDLKMAKRFQALGWVAILGYCILGLTFLLPHV